MSVESQAKDFHDETFGFRFNGLSRDLQSRIRAALPGFKIESRDPEIAVVILAQDQDLAALYALLEREDFDPLSYGVWISLVTSRERDSVQVPQTIVDLVRRTGSGLDFSFVACLGSDDE